MDDEVRKKVIENIKSSNIDETVKKLKEFPEPEQQMEILEEFEDQEETSKEMFNSIVQKKKEIAEGTTYRKAINKGFRGAMVVILDSNITTFLTGLVLFYFGGPSIRGFAVTLMVGIVATIISGVYFLRSAIDFILDCTSVKKIWM